jgi:hypothetical protein
MTFTRTESYFAYCYASGSSFYTECRSPEFHSADCFCVQLHFAECHLREESHYSLCHTLKWHMVNCRFALFSLIDSECHSTQCHFDERRSI